MLTIRIQPLSRENLGVEGHAADGQGNVGGGTAGGGGVVKLVGAHCVLGVGW